MYECTRHRAQLLLLSNHKSFKWLAELQSKICILK